MALAARIETIHDRIEGRRQEALPEADSLRTFRDYARGRQRATLTPGHERILRGLLGNLFCDNVCKRVLQELRNRLRLVRFSIEGDQSVTSPLLEFLHNLWVLNRIGALSAAVHWAMLRDGN